MEKFLRFLVRVSFIVVVVAGSFVALDAFADDGLPASKDGHPDCYSRDYVLTPGWIAEWGACYWGGGCIGFVETCISHPSYPEYCGDWLRVCTPPCTTNNPS